MRSFIIWITAVSAGAALGYAISVFTGIHPVVSVGGAMLIGSSLAITANIMRSKEHPEDY